MKYKNIEFDAIVATPGCGKSYLCDKYPNRFVDVDEVRLRCKYDVPQNITRAELERTKGHRTFEKRNVKNLKEELFKQLDKCVSEGKILIAAPHPEAVDYLVQKGLKFCFVYPSKALKNEIVRRLAIRGNAPDVVKENEDFFDEYYEKDKQEKTSVLHYEIAENEYLEDILRKFGCKF